MNYNDLYLRKEYARLLELSESSDDADLWYAIAKMYTEQGVHNLARKALGICEDQWGEDARLLLLHARLASQENYLELAADYLQQAIPIAKSLPLEGECHFMLGEVQRHFSLPEALHAYQQSFKSFEKAVAKKIENAHLDLVRAAVQCAELAAIDNRDTAERYLNKAHAYTKDDSMPPSLIAWVWIQTALVYEILGHFKTAEYWYEQALIMPDADTLRLNHALINKTRLAMWTNRDEDAEYMMQSGITFNDYRLTIIKGWIHALKKRH